MPYCIRCGDYYDDGYGLCDECYEDDMEDDDGDYDAEWDDEDEDED